MIEIVEEDEIPTGARIKVIGVGGGGGNAINTMISAGLTGVEFIAMNTDAQDLRRSLAGRRFQLGTQLTKGLGAGANPEVGREAALEDRDRIAELVVGAAGAAIAARMSLNHSVAAMSPGSQFQSAPIAQGPLKVRVSFSKSRRTAWFLSSMRETFVQRYAVRTSKGGPPLSGTHAHATLR